MKRCDYCGRENEDNAVRCRECDTSKFKGFQPVTPVLVRCDRCGATTDVPGGFVQERKPFSASIRTLCPACWQKRQVLVHTALLIFQLTPGPLGLFLLASLPDKEVGWLLLNLFVFQIAMIVSALPHELGHACIARILGWRVFKIFFGMGKTLFKAKLLGFDTEFRAIPLGGIVVAAPQDPACFRRKLFTFVLAGPLANAILMLITWTAMGGHTTGWRGIVKHLLPLQMLFAANLLILFENLLPKTVNTPLGKRPSDGQQLLNVFSADAQRAVQSHVSRFVWESVLCEEKNQLEAARSWLEKGLTLYPDNLPLLTTQGNYLIYQQKFNEARECYLKILPRTGKDHILRLIVLNNIAYVDALLGGTELLAEADRYSVEAMAMLSWMPSIKGTRGTVLSELGKLDEAATLLREAMQTHDIPRNRAQNACLLAIAEVRRGNLSMARKCLEEARKLDSTCFLLERAQKVLDGANG